MEITPRNKQRESRIVWFEIPTEDLKRAIAFYESVFAVKLQQEQFGTETIAVFPYEPPAISGCLIHGEGLRPGHGTIPALNADPSLDEALERVERAGGTILTPRTELPPGMGCFARIEDTEGNLVGLHAVS